MKDKSQPTQPGGLEAVVAARLREIRTAREMTQAALAKAMTSAGYEMHQTTVAKIEAGSRPIRVNELAALASILEVRVTSLVETQPMPDQATGGARLKKLVKAEEAARDLLVVRESVHRKAEADVAEAQTRLREAEARLSAATVDLRESEAEWHRAMQKLTKGEASGKR